MAEKLPKQNNQSSIDLQVWLENLMTTGKQVAGTSTSIDISERPDYFEEDRFKRAQKLIQKYYTNISMATSTGLLLLLQFESIGGTLAVTGKSRTVTDLWDRYTATAKYMRKIYETDFVDPSSEGWKYLMMVRKMHERIHTLMNQDPNRDYTGKDEKYLWVNQYDMALTQFAFIGLFVLRPDKCAAYYITQDELMDVVYYWRIISYYFGIEERFNLFIYHDDYEKQLQLLNLFHKHQCDTLDEKRDVAGLKMAKGFMLAFEDFIEDLSFNIIDHWWHPFVSISGEKQLTPYTWSDRYKMIFFLLYYKVLFRSEFLMGLINEMYKKKFEKFCEDGAKIKEKLSKKYKDYTCEY